jgi:hypothetical protein
VEWQPAAVGQPQLPRHDLGDGGAQDGLDAGVLEEHAQQPLPTGQPADAEVAQERLGGHIGDRGPLGEAVLAELVGEVEDELISGAEAAGALGGGHHHRPGVGQQLFPAVGGGNRARQGGDGVGRAAGPAPGIPVKSSR